MTQHDGDPGAREADHVDTEPIWLGKDDANVPDLLPPGPVDPQPALPPRPSFPPPSGPPPNASWHDYAGTAPLRSQTPVFATPTRSTSPPQWSAIALLALAIGLLGGLLGGVAYDVIDDDDEQKETTPVLTGPGLDPDSIVTLPPVTDGSVAAVAEALLPSTVQIIAEYQGDPQGATGSGFVLDSQGHIVTNNHVVDAAAKADGQIQIVDQDGNRHRAELVGRSPVYDLAVLYVEKAKEFQPAALGASKQLRVGDGVVAIGSPLGLSSTVTSGIVSALDRPVTTGDSGDESSYINAIQTDAAINPGNSGGPLVNLAGQVVGVNSAIATTGSGVLGGESGNIGVGFAIPVEQVRITADQILRTGEASYPVIGASVNTGGTHLTGGARLADVNDGEPADRAGLKADDVITAVGDQRVFDGISLIVSIRTHLPGETVEFTYLRNGKERKATITLGGRVG